MTNTKTAPAGTLTDTQAADLALLLITRKLRRMAPTEFDRAWRQLPDGAKNAINAAEMRADVLRDQQPGLTWPSDDTDEND